MAEQPHQSVVDEHVILAWEATIEFNANKKHLSSQS